MDESCTVGDGDFPRVEGHISDMVLQISIVGVLVFLCFIAALFYISHKERFAGCQNCCVFFTNLFI